MNKASLKKAPKRALCFMALGHKTYERGGLFFFIGKIFGRCFKKWHTIHNRNKQPLLIGQWEALSHDTAGQIINESIEPFVDYDCFKFAEQQENSITRQFRFRWSQFIV